MDKVTRATTFEDRFARKFYCNSYRFTSKMKRNNRRKFRRLKKKELQKTLDKV